MINYFDQLTNNIATAYFRSSGYSDLPTPALQGRRRPATHVYEPIQRVVKAVLSASHQFVYQYTSPIAKVSTIVRLAPPQHYGRQRRLDLR